MKFFTTILFFALSCSVVFGQLETKIDSLFSEFNNSPGAAVGVYSDGKTIFKKGYGIANLDYDIKISSKTVFDIGSVSKQFTAACIVILENEGKLSLDDDVRKYLPEMTEFKEGKITIRHLLHHTSGLRDYLTLMFFSGRSFDDYFTEKMGLDILSRQKELNFKPGTEYMYSNSGYLALAIIVKRISGESIGTFAQKNLFDPLGMENTFIYEDATKVVKNRAIGYRKEDAEFKREHHFDFVGGGDGQVYSTVKDFFKWSENFKSNKLGDSTFLSKMLKKGKLSNGDTIPYALGLFHGNYKNLKTISHGGAWGGFRAYYVQFPSEYLSIAIMSNLGTVNTERKAMQIAELILNDKLIAIDEKKKSNSNAQSEQIVTTKFLKTQLTGNYEIQAGAAFELTIKNDSLNVLQTWNNISYNIINTTGNTYELPDDNSIQFVFSKLKNNFTQKITVFEDGNKTTFKRKEKINTAKINLQDYTGNYYSEELDVAYSIFTRPEFEIAQIVIEPFVAGDEEKRIIEALVTMRKDVLENGSSFSSKAILHSQDPESRSRGGSYTLDENYPQMIKEFREQAFNLEAGEISKPFKTKYGWHIVTVEKIRGPQRDIRHVLLVPNESEAALEKARNTLVFLREQIVNGEISFSDAAREFSDDQLTNDNGGVLMIKESGDTYFELDWLDPEMKNAILELKDNEVSNPILEVNQSGNKKKYKIVTVLNHKDKLKVKIPNNEARELMLYKPDIFNSNNALFRFSRRKGTVEGFEFDFGRVNNLKFNKK